MSHSIFLSSGGDYTNEDLERGRQILANWPMNSSTPVPTFQRNFVFCSVMTDPDICKKFLERVLGFEIAELEYIEPEKTLKNTLSGHGIRLDVAVKDIKGNAYDIEMQCDKAGALPLRSRYYHSVMDNHQLAQGKSYDKLPNSMVIFICTFDLFGQNESKYVFGTECLNHPGIFLEDKRTTIFLNTKGLRKDLPENLCSLLDFIETAEPTDDFTNEIMDSIALLTLNTEWRGNYMTYEEDMEVRSRYIFQQGIERGIEQGIERGIEQGIEQGIERGIEQGIKRGKETGQKELLISLISKKLEKGKSPEVIAEELEEPVEKIQNLIQQMESVKG